MKKLFLIPILILILSSCKSDEVTIEEKHVNVEVKTLEIETYEESIKYIGIVKSNQVKKYSFKSGGYLEKIYIRKSQQVNLGDKLASLSTKDIEFQAAASKGNMDAAYSNYQSALKGSTQEDINNASLNVEKTKALFEFNQKNYDDLIILHKEGAISQSALEQAKLSLDVSQKEYLQSIEILNKTLSGASDEEIQAAYSQYLSSKSAYNGILSIIEDSTIISDISGKVVDILYEESEAIPQGYPVVIVSSDEIIIETGISQKDMYQISLTTPCIITVNDKEYMGTIKSISNVPEENSFTHLIIIGLEIQDENIFIGTITDVRFVLGEATGIWLDIKNILNDGENYVYIVENDIAIRKNINILYIQDDKVLVDGVYPNDILITKGLDMVNDGYKIEILK
jgi:multidrug resistance efflux pump